MKRVLGLFPMVLSTTVTLKRLLGLRFQAAMMVTFLSYNEGNLIYEEKRKAPIAGKPL